MNVYKYDQQTKEYTGVEVAMLDPLETQLQQKEIYLLPADATFSAPTLQEGYVSVFKEGVWENIEDNRGKEYWLQDDAYGTPARKMEILGALPADAMFTPHKKKLEQVKQEKIIELKIMRDTAEVEPITYQGYSFDYDSKARERISAAIIALEVAGASASLIWTTADNKDVNVTASDLRGIIAQVAVRSDKLHTAYRKAKEKVENATTKEEVETVELEV